MSLPLSRARHKNLAGSERTDARRQRARMLCDFAAVQKESRCNFMRVKKGYHKCKVRGCKTQMSNGSPVVCPKHQGK